MADSITLAVQNPKADNQAVIFVDVKATLHIILANQTGADIQMTTGSSLEIFMPQYFTVAQLQAMGISNMSQSGWKFSYNSTDISLMLDYTGADGAWADGTAFTFDIENVLTTANPGTDSVQVNFTGLKGSNIPTQLSTPLVLNNSVAPTNIDLRDVLQVNLDNQGAVFVSVQIDPLKNTIYLNFKNITRTPLYDGSSMWSGTPKVTVSFVYGTTSGSLAPDQKSESTSLGSAWKISGSVYVDQTEGWNVSNPKVSGQQNAPAWNLAPNSTNQQIIGTGDQSNVTFAFSNIVSLTPTGNTQMYVQFTGFTKNENTVYNDHLFVLNIAKQNAPVTRGLLNFFSSASVIALNKPQSQVQIPLRWSMYFVDSIQLLSNVTGIRAINKSYPDAAPVNSDKTTMEIPAKITQDTPVMFTVQAFDGNGGFLNAMQFSVFLSAQFFVDPRDNKVYPTVYINNQIWMAANLDYEAPSGSVLYDHNSGYETQYGRLYTAAAAQNNIPAGWRLPTQSDWEDLFKASSYTELIAGGSSGFEAQLGGYGDDAEKTNFNDLGPNGSGYYWSSTPDSQNAGNNFYGLFYSTAQKVNANNSYPTAYYLSVRYVKNSIIEQ